MGLFRKLVQRVTGPRCNICGGYKFTHGPGGRLGRADRKPCCARCYSLERHRAFRKIFLGLDPRRFSALRCLQFSKDPTIDARWFGRLEISVYDQQNSLDLQRIERPDESYDVIVCNHILEHVPDYRAGLRELARVLSPQGFLFLSFPDPFNVEHTMDWGYPDPAKHAHYRHFGRDIEEVFRQEMPECHVAAVTTADDITGSADMAYVVTRSADWLRRVRGLRLETRICEPRPQDAADRGVTLSGGRV